MRKSFFSKFINTGFVRKNIYEISFFLILLVLSSIFYNGFCELLELPKGMHQWKQSLHYSMIVNYISGNTCFWFPEIHDFINPNNTGNLVLEFPVFHFLTAFIVRNIPSATPVLFRWIMFAITIFGYYYMYKLSDKHLNNKKISLLITFLSYVIPVVVFYGASFMVDVQAMALAFPAIYFFEKNLSNRSIWNVLIFTICLSLSGMLRLPVLIFPLAYFGARLITGKYLLHLLWLLPSLIFIALWYYHVKRYNTYYVSYPPDETFGFLSEERTANVIQSYCDFTLYQMGWAYRYIAFYVSVIVFLIFYRKKVEKFWFLVLVFMTVGTLIYGYLWFGIFLNHDYYTIPVIPLFFLIWLVVFMVAVKTNILKYVTIAAGVLMVINTVNTFDNMKMRTYFKNVSALNIFSGKEETWFWNFAFQEDYSKWEDLRKVSPYSSDILRKNGILPGDTAVCDFDGAPAYALSLLDMKGWTLYNYPLNSVDDYKIMVKMGAKYLVSNRTVESPLDDDQEKYLKMYPVFTFGNLEVFNIEHLK